MTVDVGEEPEFIELAGPSGPEEPEEPEESEDQRSQELNRVAEVETFGFANAA